MLWSEYGKVGWEWVVQAVRGRKILQHFISNGEGHRLFELFKRIRPKPAVNWIVGPRYSFGVFSMSRFAHLALSSVDDPN